MDWIRLVYWCAAFVVALTFWSAPARLLYAIRRGRVTRRASYHAANAGAVLVIAGWLLAVAGILPDASWLPSAVRSVVRPMGLAAALVGFAFALWARLRLGRWFAPSAVVLPGQTVVDDGPYAWVRHPFYAGLWWALACGAVALDSIATLVAAVALAPLLDVLAKGEEQLLTHRLGRAYRAYMERVPRWMPRRPSA